MDNDPLLDLLNRLSDATFNAAMAWDNKKQQKMVVALTNAERLAHSALVLAKLWRPTSPA